MLKPNARMVLDYVMSHEDEKITANDIADALGLQPKSVNGIITQCFTRKDFMVRVEEEEEQPNGKTKVIKYIEMTDAGRSHNFDAEE